MTTALSVSGLRVESDAGIQLAVDKLEVARGRLVVVTGPADSGKSLLAAVLAGRVGATTGSVLVEGRALSGSPAARRRLGLAATIADGGRIAGCTVREALRLAGSGRAGAALDRFPLLAGRATVRAELLSGGEQQLLQVACAWCADARVMVLDSPTTGLADDVATIVRQVAGESATAGAAVVWLDQSAAAAPLPAQWMLDSGVLSAVAAAASTSDQA